MKSISGAEAVIRCLIKENVDVLFGYPGGAIMPVYDELYKFQDKVHHILTRHEQGATHAAQGYARSSGKVGVAIATSGPCLLYTSPSPRDKRQSRMPSSA